MILALNVKGVRILGILAALLIGDIFLLKLLLVITNAQSKRKMKWVAISFLIQFGLIFLICLPIFLEAISGEFEERGPDPGMIIPFVFFSIFIDLNLINIIHKPGMVRSFIMSLFISAPIIASMFILGPLIANPP